MQGTKPYRRQWNTILNLVLFSIGFFKHVIEREQQIIPCELQGRSSTIFYLNICTIQSQYSIRIDKTSCIQDTILEKWFPDASEKVDSDPIPFKATLTTNTKGTQKPDNPLKGIRNKILQNLDNLHKGIQELVPNEIWIQCPIGLTVPT